MDVIYQGTTWRRQVTILDEALDPIDPTQLAGVLRVPDVATWDRIGYTVPLTVTGPDDPGVYEVSLTADETADLPAQMATRWELVGLIGSDTVALVQSGVLVQPFAVRLEE